MRHTVRVAVFALLLCVLVGAGGPALAQQAPQLSPSARLLQPYTLPPGATPAGYRSAQLTERTNVNIAGQLDSVDAVRQLVARQRITSLRQRFNPTSFGALPVSVDIISFLGADGAQADLADTSPQDGVTITPVEAPPLGDTSAGVMYSFLAGNGQAADQLVIGATVGRLELEVTQAGAAGTLNPDQLPPLLEQVVALAQQQPLPPASDAERAVLATQTQPRSILHDAYITLLANYAQKLVPADVLGNTFRGVVTTLGLQNAGIAAPAITAGDPEQAWQQFLPAYRLLEAQVGDAGAQNLAYAAATAMYGSLNNCHTTFFRAKAWQRFLDELKGKPFAGIGVTISPHAPFTILSLLPGRPAEQAGVVAGDQIVAVDGVVPEENTDHGPSDLIRGDPGTVVVMTLLHAGAGTPVDIPITRQIINPTIESHRILPGGIGYIEFDSFVNGDTAVDAVSTALQDFAASGNVSGWVLDLRANGGGSELTLERIAGLFAPRNSVVVNRIRQDGTRQTGRTIGDPVADQRPLVILVGPATASSAEILTETLKDLGRATVVGTTSAGCVNGGYYLGLLDLTGVFVSVGVVLAGPEQVPLEGVGITPDMAVTRTSQDLTAGRDPQLDAAIQLLQGQSGPPAP